MEAFSKNPEDVNDGKRRIPAHLSWNLTLAITIFFSNQQPNLQNDQKTKLGAASYLFTTKSIACVGT